MRLENVEIGPSIDGQLLLNVNYAASRFMLPTFRAVSDEQSETEFQLRGETYMMPELVEHLVVLMDIAFNYAMYGLTPVNDNSIDKKLFQESMDLFKNDKGIPHAASLYGLVLRPGGAGVFQWATAKLV